MNANEILKDLRAAVKGEKTELDISEILYSHRCHFLIIRRPEWKMYSCAAAEIQLNKICVAERYKAISPVLSAFDEEDIKYAVIKGAPLSLAAYKDTSLRLSGDIDLLIRRRDIDRVKSIMLQAGFIQGRVTGEGIKPFSRRELLFQTGLSHQTAPFVCRRKNPLCPYVNADINTDIMWGESDIKADMELVLSKTKREIICGAEISRLEPPMEFISLCTHHYKDMNSIYLLAERGFRLDLLTDILFYLKNTAPNAEEIASLAEATKTADYVYYCVAQTSEIFGGSITDPYLSALRPVISADLTNCFGLTNAERRKWDSPLSDRLFDPDFRPKLCSCLSEEDLKKININRVLM